MDIRLPVTDAGTETALNAAFAAITEVHRLMSYHDAGSDVTRLNRGAARAAVRVHPWTWEVLACAQRLSEASAGLFDCTVGAHLIRLGYLPETDRPPADADATYRDVILLQDDYVRFARPLCIDLGGIAKGYAVDQAVRVLREHGLKSGCVNAGGDMRVFGERLRGQRFWPVSVRLPGDPSQALPLLRIQDAAIATSADYYTRKTVDNVTVSPLIDPRSGRGEASQYSVTVVAPCCMHADALTKIVRLSGDPDHAVLAELGAHAIVLDESGRGVGGRGQ